MDELPCSLTALRDWVSHTDIQNFKILLCIGNKADLVAGHPAHSEYRRRLLKLEDSAVDLNSKFSDYGISESEGTSLLWCEEPSRDIRSIEIKDMLSTSLSVHGDLKELNGSMVHFLHICGQE
ncbi:hypothetical protein RJT34_30360 [Clitoria ternatea]|uniref:Uncharacterized protein n=1 Tax=Clitoria ternatea TaxID=43366 RepID=A0AAN9I3Z5_CLITE